jgi:hypothetical protein
VHVPCLSLTYLYSVGYYVGEHPRSGSLSRFNLKEDNGYLCLELLPDCAELAPDLSLLPTPPYSRRRRRQEQLLPLPDAQPPTDTFLMPMHSHKSPVCV